MALTVEDIKAAGYGLKAAEKDSWRVYDEENPVPGYFQFDWISGRYPDLYHAFALSSIGLIEKLHTIVDFSGMKVLDIGAGTGRSSSGIAQRAKQVHGTDVYESVIDFGKREIERLGVRNVEYSYGDRDALPFADNTFDAATFSWAEVNHREAYRVLKDGGYLIQMGSVPEALCGELNDLLNGTSVNDPAMFLPGYPDSHEKKDGAIFSGVPLSGPVDSYRFTYTSKYESPAELAAIVGRFYGPKAKNYFLSRDKDTYGWRLEILVGRVKK